MQLNKIINNKLIFPSSSFQSKMFTVPYANVMHMRFAEITLNMEYFDIYDMNIFVCLFNAMLQINSNWWLSRILLTLLEVIDNMHDEINNCVQKLPFECNANLFIVIHWNSRICVRFHFILRTFCSIRINNILHLKLPSYAASCTHHRHRPVL